MNLLAATGEKMIVESAYDCLWGCGIPLQDSTCLNEEKWSSDNLLGKMLMHLHATNKTFMQPIKPTCNQ